MKNIRNFCIIAHIDHGKSTLADRFLEVTSTIEKRDMKHGQMLDTMELEQERGITIKLQPVRMDYKGYILNLIDTPGHVDFTYEVSRSLAACEGAILVVDATQGIQAQTLANLYMAMEHNLTIIPVVNKIDMPQADPERVKDEIENMLAIPRDEVIEVSAKTGQNVEEVLQAVIDRVPNPLEGGLRKQLSINSDDEAKALVFDSVYDTYRGVVSYVRLVSGTFKKGDKLRFLNAKTDIDVTELGYFRPKFEPKDVLLPGEVGYVVTGLKSVGEARVGDTIWKGEKEKISSATPLPGYKKVVPMVYAGIYCTEGDDFPMLRDALEKLTLNDSALIYEPDQSPALGSGFRCGFLGLLHMDIVQERLEREYDVDIIVTAPSVSYRVNMKSGEQITISAPSMLPDPSIINSIEEPWIKMEVVCPKDTVGGVMKLVQQRRGTHKNLTYIDADRVLLFFEMPLATVIIDFYDGLKNVSSGYASMNYEFIEYRVENLVRLDIMIAGDKVDSLATMCHRTEAEALGRRLAKKLKEVIPRAQFAIPIQAAIGGKIVARETISAFRKDVTAGLYGGDVTRKNKQLQKQKKGKKRMKQMGSVSLPQDAFHAILKKD
ncbi:translation elongation factor 4 [Patescibacteria group bacterium]|nr:translation elongation factor 4 [Patescibacteria group bacterium]MBU1015553.1 translation elongation factor 4 [Patescibacteria group bacterium]MBU1685604.1 translation elongation factor 4 [Patescibacteria group bacterium]MBU1938978.1 translation elongation factor 4 [Patescibacteria group bacterium]